MSHTFQVRYRPSGSHRAGSERMRTHGVGAVRVRRSRKRTAETIRVTHTIIFERIKYIFLRYPLLLTLRNNVVVTVLVV